ncbi:hypothetical protein EJV44_19525 [Ancylobacter aquaticus]|nr:hypothetical protein EJV44_19525 [Ancylobacter aquaticus]
MRLRRLDLTRYGRFTDQSLGFGPRPEGLPDLHIVYGPNEAGKSTAFAAFLDLLFGIGTQSPFNFLHPYSTMRIHHPIWTKLASTVFVATGVGLLWLRLPIVAAALIFYGIGIESIARGTLPLAVFGARHYPAIMGRIAMPSLIGQAASPTLGAMLIDGFGANGALAALFVVAIANVFLVIALLVLLKRPSRQHPERVT